MLGAGWVRGRAIPLVLSPFAEVLLAWRTRVQKGFRAVLLIAERTLVGVAAVTCTPQNDGGDPVGAPVHCAPAALVCRAHEIHQARVAATELEIDSEARACRWQLAGAARAFVRPTPGLDARDRRGRGGGSIKGRNRGLRVRRRRGNWGAGSVAAFVDGIRIRRGKWPQTMRRGRGRYALVLHGCRVRARRQGATW